MPYIIHLHGAEFQTFFTNELGYSGKAFVRLIFSKAFRVIGLSSAWGIWIAETFKSAHVSVIFNGVPSSKPKKKGGGVEKLTILFLGRLSERKGTNDLIEAMQEVVKVFPEALLELGGDGDINAYRSKTANFDYVQVLGWMNDEQRLAALGRATIYCLPSWNEGLPMSILEAMSAELPIISTPVGGIPEAVVHGVTGLLVPPGDVKAIADSICMLLSEPSLCKEMGIAGRSHHLALFSDIAMGSQILDVYKSCLQH